MLQYSIECYHIILMSININIFVPLCSVYALFLLYHCQHYLLSSTDCVLKRKSASFMMKVSMEFIHLMSCFLWISSKSALNDIRNMTVIFFMWLILLIILLIKYLICIDRQDKKPLYLKILRIPCEEKFHLTINKVWISSIFIISPVFYNLISKYDNKKYTISVSWI